MSYLHQTKSSSGISLRCTCLALPATSWLDDPRERDVHRLIGWKHCCLTHRHRLQSLCCVPLESDVGCASGKNNEHRLRVPESSRPVAVPLLSPITGIRARGFAEGQGGGVTRNRSVHPETPQT
jgi:hypothetical protein